MEHLITHVEPGSAAMRAGIRCGDILLTLDGHQIIDEIDYQALIAQKTISIRVRRESEELAFTIHRRGWESVGLHFGESMVLKPRICHNNCVFCFISQMPPKMRESLYVKDDDWRYSLMMGNFVTLTNVDDEEFERILLRKASPLYISVHATDPDLRVRMMRNPNAANLLPRLERLREAGLRFHCQVVVCPGLNDGAVLEQTINDLSRLHPAAESVALVPVGLTRFRERLYPLRPFTSEESAELLDMVDRLQLEYREKFHTNFVFPSDEFYAMAQRPLPDEEWYEDFAQIENGVGLIRRLVSELESAARQQEIEPAQVKKRCIIPTGTSFAPYLEKIIQRYAPSPECFTVLPVRNRFFGETVTVTGLLTGHDVLDALHSAGDYDEVLLCSVMLRHEGDLFLDDLSIEDFKKALSARVTVLENDGYALYRALMGYTED